MRSTEKINNIVTKPKIIELKLDAESLGKLIRAKALQAVAMHFAVIGLGDSLGKTKTPSSHPPSVHHPSVQKMSVQKLSVQKPSAEDPS